MNKSDFLKNFEKALKDNDNTPSKGGIGFLGLLTIAFIVLKLTGVIAWAWLWVLSPLWMPLALFVVIVAVLLLLLLVGLAVITFKHRK